MLISSSQEKEKKNVSAYNFARMPNAPGRQQRIRCRRKAAGAISSTEPDWARRSKGNDSNRLPDKGNLNGSITILGRNAETEHLDYQMTDQKSWSVIFPNIGRFDVDIEIRMASVKKASVDDLLASCRDGLQQS
jgi:hypothetical protein